MRGDIAEVELGLTVNLAHADDLFLGVSSEDDLGVGQAGGSLGVVVLENEQVVDVSLAELGIDDVAVGIGVDVDLLVQILIGEELVRISRALGGDKVGLVADIVAALIAADLVAVDGIEGIGGELSLVDIDSLCRQGRYANVYRTELSSDKRRGLWFACRNDVLPSEKSWRVHRRWAAHGCTNLLGISR